MKSDAERKADERTRMRARGYILRHLWVHPSDWERVKKFIARLMKRHDH
jgi:hypothetical protein